MQVYDLRGPAVGKEVELERKLSYELRLSIFAERSLVSYEFLLDAFMQVVTSAIVDEFVASLI